MKTQIPTFFILIISGYSQAQTLQDGTYKTENERFSESKATFDALIAKEPNNGTYYFYKAENFYEWSQVDKAPEYVDSAKATWLMGANLSPENPLSHDDVVYKFRNVVESCLSKHDIDRVIALTERLDTTEDTSELFGLLAAARHKTTHRAHCRPPPLQNAPARVEMAAASVAGVRESAPQTSPECLQR
jgi:hypothetical protein